MWLKGERGKARECGVEGGCMEVEYKVLEIAGAEEKKMGFFHTAVKCSVTISKCGGCASREQGSGGGWEGEGGGRGGVTL